jgi:hypothetical protein
MKQEHKGNLEYKVITINLLAQKLVFPFFPLILKI